MKNLQYTINVANFFCLVLDYTTLLVGFYVKRLFHVESYTCTVYGLKVAKIVIRSYYLKLEQFIMYSYIIQTMYKFFSFENRDNCRFSFSFILGNTKSNLYWSDEVIPIYEYWWNMENMEDTKWYKHGHGLKLFIKCPSVQM